MHTPNNVKAPNYETFYLSKYLHKAVKSWKILTKLDTFDINILKTYWIGFGNKLNSMKFFQV